MVSGTLGFLGCFRLPRPAVSVRAGRFRAQSFKNLSSGAVSRATRNRQGDPGIQEFPVDHAPLAAWCCGPQVVFQQVERKVETLGVILKCFRSLGQPIHGRDFKRGAIAPAPNR